MVSTIGALYRCRRSTDRPASLTATRMEEKLTVTPVASLRAPIGGQEIELQQIDYVHGGLSLLRIRIREGRRFTVFDIDAATAAQWGEQMAGWARAHPGATDTST
jgi:hypothetical protein